MDAEEAREGVVLHLVGGDDLVELAAPLQRLLDLQGFTGDVGQRAIVTDSGLQVFVGMGSRADRQTIRSAITSLGLPTSHGVRLGVVTSGVTDIDCAVAARRELVVAGYTCEAMDARSPEGIEASVEAVALKRARRWTNASGAALYPSRFADVANDLAQETELSVDVWNATRLEAEGCRAILAVGQGSIHEPRLVDVRYEPTNPVATVTLVGKGVTFDTGGLSLKSPAAMASMRMDKVGAATILAVMSTLPEWGIPVRVRGLLPLAENMIGPRAVRPGDVVVGRSGVPITIMDTDFEGRVLLSDALTLACEEPTDAIIDVAALTYQVAIALGNEIGGLFSNDDRLALELVDAGRLAGEDWWRLPLAHRYLPQVVTADGVKNHPESDVGRAITAALFLERFVSADIPWAHLDMTGVAWSGPASGPGATGAGVRTLIEFLRLRAAEV